MCLHVPATLTHEDSQKMPVTFTTMLLNTKATTV